MIQYYIADTTIDIQPVRNTVIPRQHGRMINKMAKYRTGRLNEEISKELASILRTVKDPRVSDSFVSVTGVDCTPDLKYCKIYFSSMGGKYTDDDIKAGLNSACGYIRGCLARQLNLRATPELKFFADDSIKNGAHINELLKQVSDDLTDDDDTEDNENV